MNNCTINFSCSNYSNRTKCTHYKQMGVISDNEQTLTCEYERFGQCVNPEAQIEAVKDKGICK